VFAPSPLSTTAKIAVMPKGALCRDMLDFRERVLVSHAQESATEVRSIARQRLRPSTQASACS
jgi:hypothetical protein